MWYACLVVVVVVVVVNWFVCEEGKETPVA